MIKLPKPAQEDGAAISLASHSRTNRPDVTLVRVIEPTGADVYRSIEKAGGNPMQNQMQMQMNMRMMMMMGQQPGGKPQAAPSHISAAGDAVRMELVREGNTIRFQVVDAKSTESRYLGQLELGSNDVLGGKAVRDQPQRPSTPSMSSFATSRSRIHDRINGLGTSVRTVFDEVVYADPTSIEKVCWSSAALPSHRLRPSVAGSPPTSSPP